jgi:DNA repair protein SbcC/Rad50
VRPLRLELEGFGPYREKQGVDFSDVELFAITGPTGSGKSTLLDAMAFALYGLVPRVGKSVKELVHPGVGEARVRLTFQVGARTYQVERVRGKRSEGRLFDLTEGERLVPLETLDRLNGAIEDLLGLSYEAFTRALLLPQGEFDRFLKGEPRERRRLLMDLFGLSRLERVREKAAERKARYAGEKSRLEGELMGLAGATPEALADLDQALEALVAERRQLEGEKPTLEARAKEAEALLELLRRMALLEAKRERLAKEASEIENLRARLALSEEAARALPLWEDLRRKEGALAATRARLKEAEGAVKGLEEALKALAFDEGALQEARDALLKAQGLKALEALLRRVGPLDHPAPRLDPERLEAVLEEEAKLERLLSGLSQLEEARRRLKAKEDRLEEARQRLAKTEEAGREKRKEVEDLRARLQGAEAHRLGERLKALEEALRSLEKEEAGLKEALEALRREERRRGLLAFHDLLEVGKPCPLCGGLVHELPPRPELPDLEARRRELEEALRRVQGRRGEVQGEARSLKEKLDTLAAEPIPGDPEALKKALEEAEEALQALRDTYQALRDTYKEIEGEVKGLVKEVNRLRQEEEKLRAQAGGASLGEVEEGLRRLREEKAALGAGLRRHIQERTEGLGVAAYLKRLEARVRALEVQEREYRRLRDGMADLAQKVSALKAQEAEQAKALAEAEERVQGLMPEAEARAHALSPEEREALETRIRRHENELKEVEALLKEAKAQLKALLQDAPPPALPEAEARAKEAAGALKSLLERLEKLGQEVAVLEERRKDLREALRRRQEAEKRLAEVAREMALWEKLAQDLRGDNFPEYALGLRQGSLVERADELLYTLSGGRYRFRAKEGEYWVLDLWTEAERPVKTLSGGESFLASLSLALALSEELSKGRLGALFLDEGFGTLDPEALEVVAGVLESLPTQGRLVGIVTHVEALAERLPARLRVRKHPSGSRVEWA